MCVRHVRDIKSRGPSPLMALDQYCCSRSFFQRQALVAYAQIAPLFLLPDRKATLCFEAMGEAALPCALLFSFLFLFSFCLCV